MLTIVLDGITFQHAAELLLQWPDTLTERKRCCHTYIRCLEDVAFAILLSDRLVVPVNMPNVGPAGSPGELLKRSLPESLLQTIAVPHTPIEQTVQDSVIRDAIIADLSDLLPALQSKPQVWTDFLVRETQSYLGSDETLRMSGVPPERFRFAATHYVPRHAGLHEHVPGAVAGHLAKIVRPYVGVQVATDEAILEFVTSVSVTHIANFWTYDKSCAPLTKSNGVRLPHVTRAVIRELNGAWEGRLSRQIVPHALSDALRQVSSPDNVIDRMLILRETNLYSKLRAYLLEALVALDAWKDSTEVGKIISEIETLTRGQGSVAEPLMVKDIKVGIPAIKSLPSLSVTVPFEHVFMKRRYYLRSLVAAGDYKQYREHLGRVFPELSEC